MSIYTVETIVCGYHAYQAHLGSYYAYNKICLLHITCHTPKIIGENFLELAKMKISERKL
jgi:hypothetical protein